MAFRTIVIKNRCKLEYSLNSLICRGETEKQVFLDEIEYLIIQNTGVAITCALLSALIEKKVKVIFCDAKANPQAELVPYYGHYGTYKKIKQQIQFEEEMKQKIWALIIKQKIHNQAKVLHAMERTEAGNKLTQYEQEVVLGDASNREGHAAKVYFNALFGNSFNRNDDCNPINRYLNFGYSIIVSAINREIKTHGYLTELGIHHIGETNPFNLTYDFIEPLRPYVDVQVTKQRVNDENYKDYFIRLLTSKVTYHQQEMYFDNAIHLYVQSLFLSLCKNNANELFFIDYEL